MKSIFKLLIDIGPLAVFFIFYTRSDLQTAILPFMIATVIAVLFLLLQLYQLLISGMAPGNAMDWGSTVITLLFAIGFYMKSR